MNDTSVDPNSSAPKLLRRANRQSDKKLTSHTRGCRPSRKAFPLKSDWPTRLYVDGRDKCLFCGESHCIEELKLRPLFWEMGVFAAYGEFTQEYLIQHAKIEIDFEKQIVSYMLEPDILLSTFTFDGESTYYFERGPFLAAEYGKWHNMMAEAMQVLNTIKEGWPFPNLEGHRVEVVGRNG